MSIETNSGGKAGVIGCWKFSKKPELQTAGIVTNRVTNSFGGKIISPKSYSVKD